MSCKLGKIINGMRGSSNQDQPLATSQPLSNESPKCSLDQHNERSQNHNKTQVHTKAQDSSDDLELNPRVRRAEPRDTNFSVKRCTWIGCACVCVCVVWLRWSAVQGSVYFYFSSSFLYSVRDPAHSTTLSSGTQRDSHYHYRQVIRTNDFSATAFIPSLLSLLRFHHPLHPLPTHPPPSPSFTSIHIHHGQLKQAWTQRTPAGVPCSGILYGEYSLCSHRRTVFFP